MAVIESPLKAIKAYCIACSGDSYAEMKRCSSEDCPLKPFRFGRNPFRKRSEMTETEREALRYRLQQNRESGIKNACISGDVSEDDEGDTE